MVNKKKFIEVAKKFGFKVQFIDQTRNTTLVDFKTKICYNVK